MPLLESMLLSLLLTRVEKSYIHIYSSVLTLRSVGRFNFVRVCINLTSLIQKRLILMRTAVLCNGINSGQL